MPALTVSQAFATALQHHQAGRLSEAEVCYRQVLAAQPNHAGALHSLGVMAQQAGRSDLAGELIRQALALQPDFAEAHNSLACLLAAQGLFEEAMAAARRAIEIEPRYVAAHYNLGLALAKRGRLDEAVAAFRRALALQPNYPAALNDLGNALKNQGQLDEATACYRRSVALDPRFPDAHLNMGVAWLLKGQFAEAEDAYRRAIACRADLAEAHFNLAMLLLLLGRYEEGWREYEWRWGACARSHPRHFSIPMWDGKAAPGKVIFIHLEQGFGDTLLFTRYLPLVLARSQAARVILECQPALVLLLATLRSPEIEIVARADSDANLPPFDLYLPLFSMPLALQCFSPLPPFSSGLEADTGRRAQWRERLGAAGRLRVGLAWAGNPLQDDDRYRSFAPEKLAPLLSVPDIHFVSLQVEPRGPLPPVLAAAGVSDFTAEIADFADSAALIAELDLIIAVDTATAHLAGTLGRPTWVLLAFVPYWPYGLNREETPWYPAMRLFRQTTAGDWESALERAAAALRDWRV